MMTIDQALAKIRAFPDVPKVGVIFRDITPLLADGAAFACVIDEMAKRLEAMDIAPTMIASPEARGFIFGVALALRLGIGFVPIRKPGKLPGKTIEVSYDLEYGKDTLQMHEGAVSSDDQVILVDDVLATGGTILACKKLLEKEDASVIGSVFLMDLLDLNGREKLESTPVISLISY